MIDRLDITDLPVKVAGQVKDFNPLLSFSKKELRHNNFYCQYTVEATRQAISIACNESGINICWDQLEHWRQ